MFTPINIQFQIDQWTIQHLLDLYQANRLNLNPHYQRNAIWTLSTQRSLIDTIQNGYPLPNFFLRLRAGNMLEMVDGQQRCRSILGFWNGEFSDFNKITLSDVIKQNPVNTESLNSFLNYKLSICLLEANVSDKDVEDFYVLVNSSGMRLNRPELRKAAFYATRFLRLANQISDHSLFTNLNLFSDKSEGRMNDVDFAAELLTCLKWGITDKKEKVDELFKADVSEEEYVVLNDRAIDTLRKINALNENVPINQTRFKQKGDFYTLFAFVSAHTELSQELLEYDYRTLLRLSSEISPSQEECDPLLNYAINCVSQSNSKKARDNRAEFFTQLFLNASTDPTPTQLAIQQFWDLGADAYTQREGKLLLRWELLA